jgi:membrane-bound serine protease (ClpP class)
LVRRLATTALLIGILAIAGGSFIGVPAAIAAPSGHIDIVKVSGLIDPINADLIDHSLREAVSGRAQVLVIQMNSTGGVIPAARAFELAARVHASPVPVAVWVGGSSRPRAYGAAYTLLRAAAWSGAGPGSRMGDALVASGVTPDPMAGRTVGSGEAVTSHIVNVSSPTIGDFLVSLNGHAFGGGEPLSLTQQVTVNNQPRQEIRKDYDVAFAQLTVIPRLLHTVASPNVAYVMLLIALSLALFEFFTAGVGVAAGTGAVFGLLSAYGLGVLPTRPLSVALVAAGILAFAIDVQSGAPRAWTVIGAIAVALGSVRMYDGQAVSWWVLVIMAILVLFFMITGMPAMIRTRFSTPTIGRESMVGSMGVALSQVDPDGTVEVNGAPWRARTNRATPIGSGDAVRVAAIDGLVLEVEPESGAARDYRH